MNIYHQGYLRKYDEAVNNASRPPPKKLQPVSFKAIKGYLLTGIFFGVSTWALWEAFENHSFISKDINSQHYITPQTHLAFSILLKMFKMQLRKPKEMVNPHIANKLYAQALEEEIATYTLETKPIVISTENSFDSHFASLFKLNNEEITKLIDKHGDTVIRSKTNKVTLFGIPFWRTTKEEVIKRFNNFTAYESQIKEGTLERNFLIQCRNINMVNKWAHNQGYKEMMVECQKNALNVSKRLQNIIKKRLN